MADMPCEHLVKYMVAMRKRGIVRNMVVNTVHTRASSTWLPVGRCPICTSEYRGLAA